MKTKTTPTQLPSDIFDLYVTFSAYLRLIHRSLKSTVLAKKTGIGRQALDYHIEKKIKEITGK